MTDVTTILAAIDRGDKEAAKNLLPLVYDELRKLASAKLKRESPGQTLQPTALVHEAYLRLVDKESQPQWDSRGHFFAAAAESMRQILVDRAIRKARPKHGGGLKRLDVSLTEPATERDCEQLLAVNEALEELERLAPKRAQLVKLRYFAGMTLVEAAQAMGMSRATASRQWDFAKSWLYARLENS